MSLERSFPSLLLLALLLCISALLLSSRLLTHLDSSIPISCTDDEVEEIAEDDGEDDGGMGSDDATKFDDDLPDGGEFGEVEVIDS